MRRSTFFAAASAAAISISVLAVSTLPVHANHHEEGEMAAKMDAKQAIAKAVNDNAYRSDKEKARDQYRRPEATLNFMGLSPDMTVVEVGPGGGWYTSIIGPLLAENGKYIAVSPGPTADTKPDRAARAYKWREAYTADAAKFGAKASARFSMQPTLFAAPDSVDMILVFRGMHGPTASGYVDDMLEEFMAVLKPGGVLGIVQHRRPEDFDHDPTKSNKGYVKQTFLIETVENAGFELAAASEINANAKDPATWERGVWTLPPVLALGEADKDKYLAIGESDRMTLKFVKPAATTGR